MHIWYIYSIIQEDLQKILNKKLGAEGISNRSVFFFFYYNQSKTTSNFLKNWNISKKLDTPMIPIIANNKLCTTFIFIFLSNSASVYGSLS